MPPLATITHLENIHREDLTDAEKGDAVIELREATGSSYKDIAEKDLTTPYQTVRNWVWKANRISPKLSECLVNGTLAEEALKSLLKYSHVVQDQLATFIVGWNEKNPECKITSTNIGNFCKEFDKDQTAELTETHDGRRQHFCTIKGLSEVVRLQRRQPKV